MYFIVPFIFLFVALWIIFLLLGAVTLSVGRLPKAEQNNKKEPFEK